MCIDFYLKIGYYVGYFFGNKNEILVGESIDKSCSIIKSSILLGLSYSGIPTKNIGIITSPAISYLLKKEKYIGGLIISYKNDIFSYKGINVLNKFGYNINNFFFEKIKEMLKKKLILKKVFIKNINNDSILFNKYLNFCENSVIKKHANQVHILLYCFSNTNAGIIKKIFDKIGFRITIIEKRLDPKDGHIKNQIYKKKQDAYMTENMKSYHADIGIFLSKNGEISNIIDNKGEFLDTDEITYLLSKYLKIKNQIKNGIICSMTSNTGLLLSLKKIKIPFYVNHINNFYLNNIFGTNKIDLMSFKSGQNIIPNKSEFSDGIICILQILNYMNFKDKDLFTLKKDMLKFPQYSFKVKIKNTSINEESKKNKKYFLNRKISYLIKKLKINKILINQLCKENNLEIMLEARNKNKIKYFLHESRSFLKILI